MRECGECHCRVEVEGNGKLRAHVDPATEEPCPGRDLYPDEEFEESDAD